MQLAEWIRATIWTQTDWRVALAALCDAAAADASTTPGRAHDLAVACDLIDPDPRAAIEMHHYAWQLGAAPAALERAFELAYRLGDLDVLATLAAAAFERSGEAEHGVAAAHAYVDRGQPERAEPILVALVASKSEEAGSLLAAIRKQVRDPQADAATWVARANKATGAQAASKLLHAARLARLAKLDAIAERYVEQAWKVGRAPAAAILIEQDLLAQRRADDLVAFYRARVEAARGDRQWFDEMRGAATKLILVGVQRGLAHRMLRSALEAAYRARLLDIPGHLACWSLLAVHGRESRTGRELMPLVAEAFGQTLGDDERLYLARIGLELASEAADGGAASSYAAMIASLAPQPVALPPELPKVRIQTPAKPTTSPAHSVPRAPRIVVPIDVEVQVGAQSFTAVVRDVSTTGLFLLTDRDLPTSAFAKLVLLMPSRDTLDIARHPVTAKVVRRVDHGYGMFLIDPSDAAVAAITALLPA